MKVIAQETIGLTPPIRLNASHLQRREEQLPILVIAEDRFPPVSPIHYVINRAGILKAEAARHASKIGQTRENCQSVGPLPADSELIIETRILG